MLSIMNTLDWTLRVGRMAVQRVLIGVEARGACFIILHKIENTASEKIRRDGRKGFV
jgi:hypothetical protein